MRDFKKFLWLIPVLLIIIFLVLISKKENFKPEKVYATCQLPFPSCFPWPTFPVCPTKPVPEPTPTTIEPTPTTVVPTNTPPPSSPSPTQGPEPTRPQPTRPETNTCYKQCDQDYDCHSGQDCQDTGGGAKICRNPNCVSETDCECPGPAGGAVLGAEVTPTPKYGEVLGLAYTGSGEDFETVSIIGRIMVILGAFLLL